MPKLTVKQACTAREAIQALIKDDREDKYVLSSAVRIKLAGNLRKVKPVYDDYTEQRQAVFTKYGEKVLDNDGKETDQIKLKPENVEVANKELEAALNVETDVELKPVTVEDLSGVTAADKKAHPEIKENQVDVELLGVLLDVGLLTE
jgi:hypothetical protein